VTASTPYASRHSAGSPVNPLVGDPTEDGIAPVCDPSAPLIFVINGASGRNDPNATRAAIELELSAAGRSGEFIIAHPDDLTNTAMEAAVSAVARRTAVVAVGGDGTINSVAQAAHAQGCVMGVVPQGTFNYFARTHGLPSDAAAAARALLRCSAQPVQVGMVNDHVFLVNASLGLYPELLEDREAYKARFGRSRMVAFGSTVMTLLGTHRQLRLRIERGQEVREVTTPTLFVGNNRLQLEQLGMTEAKAVEEGSIAAVMLQPIGTLSMFGLLLRGAMGTLGEADSVESFQFRRMLVNLRPPLGRKTVKVAFDGEVIRMRPPLEFRVSDRQLYLLKSAAEQRSTESDSEAA
jgi:diacylglycerol kinase family enzyme